MFGKAERTVPPAKAGAALSKDCRPSRGQGRCHLFMDSKRHHCPPLARDRHHQWITAHVPLQAAISSRSELPLQMRKTTQRAQGRAEHVSGWTKRRNEPGVPEPKPHEPRGWGWGWGAVLLFLLTPEKPEYRVYTADHKSSFMYPAM